MKARNLCAVVVAMLVSFGISAPRAGQLGARSADEWIKTLESPARIQNLKITETVEMLRIKTGEVVADLGAGSGLFEQDLAHAVGPSGTVYAVDIDQALLDAINKKVKEARLKNVKTVLGKFTDPGLPEASLDVAFINDVLHHIEDRPAYLSNVARALKPGGRLVLIDFHPELGGHKDQPALQVSKDAAAKLMDGIGFKPVQEVPLFTEKYFIVYQRR